MNGVEGDCVTLCCARDLWTENGGLFKLTITYLLSCFSYGSCFCEFKYFCVNFIFMFIIQTLRVLILDSPTTFSSLMFGDSRIELPSIFVSVDSLFNYLVRRPTLLL